MKRSLSLLLGIICAANYVFAGDWLKINSVQSVHKPNIIGVYLFGSGGTARMRLFIDGAAVEGGIVDAQAYNSTEGAQAIKLMTAEVQAAAWLKVAQMGDSSGAVVEQHFVLKDAIAFVRFVCTGTSCTATVDTAEDALKTEPVNDSAAVASLRALTQTTAFLQFGQPTGGNALATTHVEEAAIRYGRFECCDGSGNFKSVTVKLSETNMQKATDKKTIDDLVKLLQ